METVEVKEKLTPLMEQYFAIKQQYDDALLFFQVGDFYELFFDDAKKASDFLAIALTKRGKNKGEDIPLCGVPVHALTHYLNKLVRGGYKVAICDQLTKPQPGTVVQRGVTQVLTPGTLTDSMLLDEKSASYLLSFYPGQNQWAMLFSELLTAQLFAVTFPVESYRTVETELARFSPDEIVLPSTKFGAFGAKYFAQQGYCTSFVRPQEDFESADAFNPANEWIEKQFNSATLMRLNNNAAAWNSLQILYFYLKRNQESALSQFKNIQFYEPEDYLILDPSTQKNLELVKNNYDSGRKNTLFSVLDKAKTPMGSRTIKKWILRPLVQKNGIIQRQEVISVLCQRVEVLQRLEELLGALSDLERIIGRIALGRAQLNDYLALKNSLKIAPEIKHLLQVGIPVALANAIQEKIANFAALVQLFETSLNDNGSGVGIIKKGFDLELDRLRDLINNGQREVLKFEEQEIISTGITSLKVAYNQISGYYIEVTNPNLDKVPAHYIEQQKLVNRKRFTTPDLKALEAEMFKAQNEIDQVESKIFDRVKRDVETYLPQLRLVAQALCYLDALFGLAKVAYDAGYVRPEFNENREIIIDNGRHAILEQILGQSFIGNNTDLTDAQSSWIITGPNMGGKSTYLRQSALICLMAQIGSFVPARQASLPILDRIFTRIGAGDNLAEGKSTFLVEMEETASICTQATRNSLVILDEVGRGTSTFDGIALAQAIVEYISIKIQARCLFATHYHELTLLADAMPQVANYNMACKRDGKTLIFLHKIVRGMADGSFGLDVARLADLPEVIITRAQEILHQIHTQQHGLNKSASVVKGEDQWVNGCELLQAEIVNLKKELAVAKKLEQEIQKTNLDELSPKQVFDLFWAIKYTFLK